MNVSDRNKMVEKGNVRSFYGGTFEPLVYTFLGLVLILFVFAPWKASFNAHQFYYVSLSLLGFVWFLALNYFIVARINCIGEFDYSVFNRIKNEFTTGVYHVKGVGKYYVECYRTESAFSGGDTHILIFYLDGKIYASAWRYGGRLGHYLPFYTGKGIVDAIKCFATR